jgi:HAD superfamily hydrolase (TIGR01509 family)
MNRESTHEPRATVSGVIFDVDGTLVDSNDAHALAWVEALTAHGQDVTFEEVRRLIGMGGDNLLPAVSGIAAESELGERLGRRRSEIFREKYLPRLQAFSGAGDLLRTLRRAGLDLAVASSAKDDELSALLALTGAEDTFSGRTSADDIEHSKPAPDAIHQALATLRRMPREAVMIGDTPYDMEASMRAGVPFIAFRSGGWQDADLAGAIAIYDGPADLLWRLRESPLAA